MDTAAKRGRPPAAEPTMPLFMATVRSRVKEQVVMSSPTSRELRSYIDWASAKTMMPDDEILVRVVDEAMNAYFHRDKCWQKDRGQFMNGTPSDSRATGRQTPHESTKAPNGNSEKVSSTDKPVTEGRTTTVGTLPPPPGTRALG